MTTDSRVATLAAACVIAGALAGCGPRDAASETATLPRSATMPRTGASPEVRQATHWPLPTANGQQLDLAVAPDGSLLLSWVEIEGDTQRLRFARWRDGRWSAVRDITSGVGIGNTADTPHVRQTRDGALWALWLRKIGEGHARDVVIARSSDDGRTWSTPVPVNTDGTATEHGFASVWPEGTSNLGVAWLDGRETGGGAMAHGGHAMHVAAATDAAELAHATMLRSAVFDVNLARRDESAVDTATCDCCQTDVVALADGPRLVYRDRAPGEIRDIALLTRTADGWGAPQRVHADGWRMPGCPVNGPAMAAAGRDLVVAWYTQKGEVPTVRLARSTDGGKSFAAPIDLASSPDVLGRIDVVMASDGAWVTWLTEGASNQTLHAAHLPASQSAVDRVVDVATLRGRGRGTGWPKLASTPDGVRLVWTDLVDGAPVLRGAVLDGR